jgi:hypothetical protein
VEDISGSPRDQVVVRSVIDMARSLGLEVIAEGVETEEQLALLAREGCNLTRASFALRRWTPRRWRTSLCCARDGQGEHQRFVDGPLLLRLRSRRAVPGTDRGRRRRAFRHDHRAEYDGSIQRLPGSDPLRQPARKRGGLHQGL